MESFIILVLTIIVWTFSTIDIMGITNVTEYKESNTKIFTYILLVYSFLVLILSVSYTTKPRAIDVYEGKTTLEITYRNGVPVDSTVVWNYNK